MNDALLKRIDTKLSTLLQKQNKVRWVKASFITDLTGWNKEQFRRAREQGIIERRKDETGIWYNLNSLPDQFIKK